MEWVAEQELGFSQTQAPTLPHTISSSHRGVGGALVPNPRSPGGFQELTRSTS